jgi:uncharacterized Zn finger protein (UPF0148 family)
MNCSHPVLYHRNGVLFCSVCGSEVRSSDETDKQPPTKENASEAPKKAVKRTRKKATDD